MSKAYNIEERWQVFAKHVLPKGAPLRQYDAMRCAFYEGHRALFEGILSMLDPGSEPTTRDVSRMESISDQLTAFESEIAHRVGKPS